MIIYVATPLQIMFANLSSFYDSFCVLYISSCHKTIYCIACIHTLHNSDLYELQRDDTWLILHNSCCHISYCNPHRCTLLFWSSLWSDQLADVHSLCASSKFPFHKIVYRIYRIETAYIWHHHASKPVTHIQKQTESKRKKSNPSQYIPHAISWSSTQQTSFRNIRIRNSSAWDEPQWCVVCMTFFE